MKKYIIGNFMIGYFGRAHNREFEEFEASSKAEAWELGRKKWAEWFKPKDGYLLSLEEKQEPVHLLDEEYIAFKDKQGHFLRVVCGWSDSAWK